VFVDARSRVPGDVDGDGETDGLDVLACARFVGRSYEEGSLALWDLAPPYDPACDRDDDGRVDEADLASVTDAFGAAR
jgi:hypothetical protein